MELTEGQLSVPRTAPCRAILAVGELIFSNNEHMKIHWEC